MNYKNVILSIIVLFFFLVNIFGQMEITNPRAMAEWEEVQGVLFFDGSKITNSTTHIDSLHLREERKVKFIIAKTAVEEGVMVYVIEPEGNGFREYCINNGIAEDKIVSVVYDPTRMDITGWERDEGPFSIYKNEVDELNFAAWYDDVGATLMANKMNVPILQNNITEYVIFTDGGNYLTDGQGRLFADSDALYGNPISDFIKEHYKNSMGVDDIVKLPPYMVHIDYYLKLINEETFVVSNIPQSNYNPQMDFDLDDSLKIQQAINYIKKNYVSCYGRPYKFVRITNAPTIRLHKLNIESPTSENGYTNALILNKTVLVPMYDSIFGRNTAGIAEFDNNALEKYREAMPGYRIVGIPGQALFMGGSVHCLTREIGATEPVLILHAWLPDTVQHSDNEFEIKATVKTKSDVKKAELFWATEPNLNYTSVQMTKTSQDTFVANIPKQAIGTKVHYYIQAESNSGKINRKPMVAPKGSFTFYVSDGTTTVAENKSQLPNKFKLMQNYPNPFNPTTEISYQLPKNNFISLIVYNTLGQEVVQLVNQRQSSGKYSVQFNATNFPSGVYIYKLRAGEFSSVKKMLLTK